MTDNINQIGSILILVLVTIILAIYSAVSTRWWVENRDRLTNKLQEPWYGLFSLASSLLAIAAIIVAPVFLLAYLMNDIKLVRNLGTYERDAVLLAWCVPGAIYNLICAFRRNKRK